MENKVIYSEFKYAKISPKKVWHVLDLVRGKSVQEASRLLKFDTTKAAKLSLKALETAVANARNAFNLSEDNLVVAEVFADAGPMAKRGQFVGRGHYSPKFKRTSHITVGLTERKKK